VAAEIYYSITHLFPATNLFPLPSTLAKQVHLVTMSNNNIKRESTPEEQQMFDQVMGYRRNTTSNALQAPHAPPVPQALETQTGGAARAAKSKKAAGKKPATEKEWNYTHMPPDPDQRKKNGRVEGRNLITWNRKTLANCLPIISNQCF